MFFASENESDLIIVDFQSFCPLPWSSRSDDLSDAFC